MNFDGPLHLPLPPLDSVAPTAVSFWTTSIFGTLAAVAFLWGLIHWRITKRPIVLLIMLGGILTAGVEPFLDVIGAAWHPVVNQNTAFQLMGRPIPWWVVSAYAAYFGGLGSLTFLALSRRPTRTQAIIWFSIPLLVDILMEELMMHWDLYFYYGQQPLIIFSKFPLWWAPCNAVGELIGISVVAMVTPYLHRWQLLLIPIVLPIADAAGYAAVGLPSWIVINSNVSPSVTALGGISTYALTILVVSGVVLALQSNSRVGIGTGGWDSPTVQNNRRHKE